MGYAYLQACIMMTGMEVKAEDEYEYGGGE